MFKILTKDPNYAKIELFLKVYFYFYRKKVNDVENRFAFLLWDYLGIVSIQ